MAGILSRKDENTRGKKGGDVLIVCCFDAFNVEVRGHRRPRPIQ